MSSQLERSPSAPTDVIAGRFALRGTGFQDGFGEVLDAFDQKTNKPVTLRRLRDDATTAAVRATLRAVGTLSHPNVVPAFGVVAGAGQALLVQGPLAGQQLGAFVAAHKNTQPISLRGAYNVVAHVCNALSAIHQSGPHGGIRPGAVFIAEGKVMLADLVMARALLARGGAGGLSPDEAGYLAPEIKANRPPTTASDIFGLGAILYVLLTGRSPTDAFIAPSKAHPEGTLAIDKELLRALAQDPSQRHKTPDEFRSALLAQLADAEQETTADFGVDVEVEVNLASLAPSRRPGSRDTGSIAIPAGLGAPRAPQITPGGSPMIGSRVSLNDAFKGSVVEVDISEIDSASKPSIADIDLKDVLAKITEDDSPRWMIVKNGMDHGPFSGRQLVNMIVQGEALKDHELLNTDSGKRGKLSEFVEFKDFLNQYELRKSEAFRAEALQNAEKSETRSMVFKLGVGLGALALIGAAGGIYALSRSGAGNGASKDAALDMYKRGEVEMTGTAGILPRPKPGSRRSGSHSGGGSSGGGLSYEDAMMQAVDIGGAGESGGEAELSAGTVAGVMNKHLNQLYGACVHGNPGKVVIDLAIAGSGAVLGASVNGGDGGLQRCVADQVRKIHFPSFPAPRMGARYSFGG